MDPLRTFADLPGRIETLVAGGERVLLILLDALGRCFLERHAGHPLLRGLEAIHPIDAQFPSTTTAHVTTLHSGLPVGLHGLYEWNVYEPALGRVVTPLRCSFAGDRESDTLLAAGFDPARLVPGVPTLYERLGVPSLVAQPAAFSPSTFDLVATRGAQLRPFGDLETAVRDAAGALSAGRAGYAYVYFDGIDMTGHLQGPSSPAFDAAARAALDEVHAGLQGLRGVHVLLTADHGQVDVDPDRTIWLDDLHPPLAALDLGPSGSSRDVFLHVPEPEVDAAIAALAPHVEVRRVSDLLAERAFGPNVGPRLLERLATVCVLPPPGRMAWIRAARDLSTRFRGHHGGRTPQETETWLGERGP